MAYCALNQNERTYVEADLDEAKTKSSVRITTANMFYWNLAADSIVYSFSFGIKVCQIA